jgi:hypothetical protein
MRLSHPCWMAKATLTSGPGGVTSRQNPIKPTSTSAARHQVPQRHTEARGPEQADHQRNGASIRTSDKLSARRRICQSRGEADQTDQHPHTVERCTAREQAGADKECRDVAGPEQVVPLAAHKVHRRVNRVARDAGDPENRQCAIRAAVNVVVWMRVIGMTVDSLSSNSMIRAAAGIK